MGSVSQSSIFSQVFPQRGSCLIQRILIVPLHVGTLGIAHQQPAVLEVAADAVDDTFQQLLQYCGRRGLARAIVEPFLWLQVAP